MSYLYICYQHKEYIITGYYMIITQLYTVLHTKQISSDSMCNVITDLGFSLDFTLAQFYP